jgi:hypothetical protein
MATRENEIEAQPDEPKPEAMASGQSAAQQLLERGKQEFATTPIKTTGALIAIIFCLGAMAQITTQPAFMAGYAVLCSGWYVYIYRAARIPGRACVRYLTCTVISVWLISFHWTMYRIYRSKAEILALLPDSPDVITARETTQLLFHARQGAWIASVLGLVVLTVLFIIDVKRAAKAGTKSVWELP